MPVAKTSDLHPKVVQATFCHYVYGKPFYLIRTVDDKL